MTTSPDGSILRLVPSGVEAGDLVVFLARADALSLGVHALDRVRVELDEQSASASVQVGGLSVMPGTAAASNELVAKLLLGAGRSVRLHAQERPPSVEVIRRKLEGAHLSPRDIRSVIRDIGAGTLHSVEVAGWACGVQAHGLDDEELVACIEAMADGGERLVFPKRPIVDVHSIGGVPGNSYAPITVSIVASHGLWIPKTSSRAISSACGTADLVEVACPVVLSTERLRAITQEVGGVLAWGGGVGIAPADDEIVRVEYPLSLDPPTQIVASVLAKKLAAGVTRVLIDIPWGEGAKIRDQAAVAALTRTFMEAGGRIGLEVECMPTAGSQPVGPALGPALELREVLRILEGDLRQSALVHKACLLAGRILESDGVTAGKGQAMALAAIQDGRALRKFKQIVAAQGGDPALTAASVRVGPHKAPVHATHAGVVVAHHNRSLVRVARAAGAPKDQGAGLRLDAEVGLTVGPGDLLMTLHADNAAKLRAALRLAEELQPVEVSPA